MKLFTVADLSLLFSEAWLYLLAPIGAIAALTMAYKFYQATMTHSEGDEEMIHIANAVRQGAMAYLRRQYKVVAVVFVALLVVLAIMAALDMQAGWTVFGVTTAGVFSGLCGWFGMKTATNASARTAYAASQSLNEGLTVAFRAGAVMGLVVVGFALLDVSVWFFLWNSILPGENLVGITAVMLTYGMGASLQALFARVGGGIYTKAADVGADLIGKVEAGIPEDDPRNPATIADNVGDNVGDVAGMGADLYESYYGSMLATMALGAAAAMSIAGIAADGLGMRLVVGPMALAGLGILCSLVGVYAVRAKEDASFSQLLKSLHMGVWAASGLIAVLSLVLFSLLFGGVAEISAFGIWLALLFGLIAGNVIAYFTEYYTSYEHKPTQSIAEQAQTGPATVIIGGTAVGMLSTWAPITTIVLAILLAFTSAGGGEHFLLGLYGVGLAAVGMLSTLGITLATDAYGPIADNAGGNAEMTGQEPIVRERTDMLDALGNTTAATGKGFAIGSAALTALALLAAYVQVVQTSLNNNIRPTDEARSSLVAMIDDADVIRDEQDNGDNGDNDHHDHAHGGGAAGGERSIAAEYRGRGDFGLVDRSDDDHDFGAWMVAATELIRHFDDAHDPGEQLLFDEIGWNPRRNVYEVTHSFQHGDHIDHLEFDLVPADRAEIDQLMGYYNVTLMNPRVLGGIFIGVLLAFVFCALTMSAVGRAAYRMMNECRRQFGIMRGQFKKDGMSDADLGDATKWPKRITVDNHEYPDYAECVAISTAGAQREMILPALMAVLIPIIVGLVLGVGGVMGMLAGGLTSGFAVAIFMANAGGAWDNAKKYIEKGHYGGKGSEAHKAGVVGDTVGDPFKDTSGPSLNILIKLIAIVSVVFAGLVVRYSPYIEAFLGLG